MQKRSLPESLLRYAIAAIVFIRILSIFTFGPMPQDAYYYLYSQHPSLSYFDHPPAIAVLLGFFTWVFGSNVVAIKLADSILTIGTVLLFYRLALSFYPGRQAIRSTMLLLSTLMVSVLSLVSTPDTPLIFFWTLSLLTLYRALQLDEKAYWIFSGIAMGLAFDSKYTAVFLPFGLLLFLLLSGSHRRLLTTIWPWLSCIVMMLVSAPVIIWNFQHHFASFAFQGSQRMGEISAFSIKPKFTLGLLGHQLALLMPVLFITLFYGLYALVRKYRKKSAEMHPNNLFLLSFFLPVFLLFLLISPVYWIKINWMMPAYISGILWASSYLNEKWFKWQMLLSLIVHLGLIVEILFYPFSIRSDDTWLGWRELSVKVSLIKTQQHADFVFSADGYKTSAELNLYSKNFIYGQNVLGEPGLEFDFLGTDLSKLSGRDAIFIDSDPLFKDIGMETLIPEKLKGYFSSVRQLPPIIIERNNKPVRKFFVYLCKGYHYKYP
ncbi:ArnT family glycosyltransferase [Pedobacter rhodius]|uniref:Glycosyltransferase family 39 protein n=1 Tax=Pedobacter rhodius TaxID=3004098 RepID=A0ABT4KWY7_9SPHI|nr:glycosyltransferase family 39 protein [Pedobacter sp. SJ11]MCZ4223451.1 glycosyltransferase family 39 protein [Pedobacter sp. SJ11]